MEYSALKTIHNQKPFLPEQTEKKTEIDTRYKSAENHVTLFAIFLKNAKTFFASIEFQK